MNKLKRTLHVLIPLVLVLASSCQRSSEEWNVWIESDPTGASVHIDGELKGNSPLGVELAPGPHTVAISREHFAPWEKHIEVPPEGQLQVDATLTFIPYMVEISSGDGSMPIWSGKEGLYFVREEDCSHRLLLVNLQTLEPETVDLPTPGLDCSAVYHVPQSETVGIHYYSTQDHLSYSNEVLLFDLHDTGSGRRFRTPGLQSGRVGNLSWSPDSQQVLYVLKQTTCLEKPQGDAHGEWCDTELWLSDTSGRQERILRTFSGTKEPIQYARWSPISDRILVQTHIDSAVWILDPNDPGMPILQIEDAYAARWSPTGDRVAYYRLKQDTLQMQVWSTDVSSKESRVILESEPDYFQWSPDGSELVYFAYNPSLEASACWAIDVETGERTLLADTSIVTHHVNDFAISPDSTKIAFESEDGNIWLLVLQE